MGDILIDDDILATTTSQFESVRLVSVSCACPGLDPMVVFGHGLGQARAYWADSQTGITYVGLGIAADLQGWGTERFRSMSEQVTALFDGAIFDRALFDGTDDAVGHDALPAFAEPQLFGGFSFSSDFTPDNTWSIYQPAHFVLPHYQLATKVEASGEVAAWLTLNTLVDGDEDAAAIVAPLKEALNEQIAYMRGAGLGRGGERPPLKSINYPMSYEQWGKMLGCAFDEFTAKRLEKVVLSRVCEIRFDEHVDVDGALAFLNSHYPDCTRFVFEPRAHHAFFGATPETLVRLEGCVVATMGLAGSAQRGESPAQDAAFGQALLDSAKDQHEHRVVVEAIRRRLEPICAALAIADTPELLKLSNIQHLFTPIQGELLESKSIFELVELLHPTPALGGAPRADALVFIDQNEPVPRGWYAAPVGVVDRHLAGTFGVAIRSAVTEYERVWLHAGAGIVAASDPQMEWDETALKFRPILNAVGVRDVDEGSKQGF